MELKLCHLYPDALNLYGDRGNILCLCYRLRRRGIAVTLTEKPIGTQLDLADQDLFFIGGGQDFEQEILLNDLAAGTGAQIRSAIADGKPFLAICGGYQMLGRSYRTWDGKQFDFLGAIDYETIGAQSRMIGNLAFRCETPAGETEIIGFENHSGKTYLGAGVAPLGQVFLGSGNNGEDGTEGVHFANVFGSYCHGPILPKNPVFCDLLLQTALERKYGSAALAPLDDTEERCAHDAALRRFCREKN